MYEYKTISTEGQPDESFEQGLNRISTDGWQVKLLLPNGRLLLERKVAEQALAA